MRFIITGGAGFIGSHLIETLLTQGHEAIAVDNLISGKRQNLPQHPQLIFIQKDILACQPEDFPHPIDGIIHLAATPSVTESWLQPLVSHRNNLSATLAVIHLCQALKIPKLVFASSAAVYGKQRTLPIVETLTPIPISPYGLQKLTSEQYASLFAAQIGFSFIGLRLFNAFGSRQIPNSPYSGAISIFVAAMQQGLPIAIYGDGTQTRDFIYVKDVAAAFTQAAIAPLEPGSTYICNIGTDNSISLNQLVEILKQCFPNWRSDIKYFPSRLGDIQHSQADISQANLLLNFQPQWSVASGMKDFVKGSSFQ
ncbi:NAD-dependent epimerase/dehydratase family protein [Scytonema millei]|uniref:NAD-dependent epimerase/dehydratase family protein n=1 Tax=Scytonema millei VB511283 TaxID=1245923 RepID=A0A9X5I4E3_9CYAN|nr:NAD-dependent epimerase/dehydratase family protein [Scytonema millei]NHC34890.1 NAD-dependent epimerase/dehydratase family protein [Scytonema millei VB511283]